MYFKLTFNHAAVCTNGPCTTNMCDMTHTVHQWLAHLHYWCLFSTTDGTSSAEWYWHITASRACSAVNCLHGNVTA